MKSSLLIAGPWDGFSTLETMQTTVFDHDAFQKPISAIDGFFANNTITDKLNHSLPPSSRLPFMPKTRYDTL